MTPVVKKPPLFSVAHSNDLQNIEETVLSRDAHAATLLIRKEHKSRLLDSGFILQACEWYFRLGLYTKGIALINDADKNQAKLDYNEKLFWLLKYYSQLNLDQYTTQLLKLVEASTPKQHAHLAGLYLNQKKYDQAATHYQSSLESGQHGSNDCTMRDLVIRRLGLADAYSAMGELEKSIELSLLAEQDSQSNLHLAISQQARGEYLAKAGNFLEARRVLESSGKKFNEGDESVDHALQLKWQGYVYGQLGEKEMGAKLMKSALTILRDKALRKDAINDVFRLAAETDMNLLAPVQSEPSFVAKDLPAQKVLKLYPNSKEYAFDGVNYYKWPNEVRLVHLIYQSRFEMTVFDAIETLFADEPFSLKESQSRLLQYLRRVRKAYSISIKINGNHFEGTSDQTTVQIHSSKPRSRFLSLVDRFKTADVEKYYSVSNRQSSYLIKQWKENGWVDSQKTGKNVVYYSI